MQNNLCWHSAIGKRDVIFFLPWALKGKDLGQIQTEIGNVFAVIPAKAQNLTARPIFQLQSLNQSPLVVLPGFIQCQK